MSATSSSAVPSRGSRRHTHTRTQAVIGPVPFQKQEPLVKALVERSSSHTTSSSQLVAALAQCEDMIGLADTVKNMNASVSQLSHRLDSVGSLLETEALRRTSLDVAQSQAKAKPPPTSIEVISAFCQWTERSCIAAVAKNLTDRSNTLQPVKSPMSAFQFTVSRIASLEEAARAEVALANIFRHMDRSAEKAVFSWLTSSDVVSPEVSSVTVTPEVRESITSATSELRRRLLSDLQVKVEELIRREVEEFSRTFRDILDSAARNFHSEHQEDAVLQPELDPFGFLFSDIQSPSRDANLKSPMVRSSRPSAVAQSRTLQNELQCRIQSDSRLLRAVVAAVSNSTLRLGSRMSIWALGLLHVYKHDGIVDSSQKKRAPALAFEIEAAERILKLVDLYTEMVQSAIEELLQELSDRIASSSADRDGRGARTAFSLKVLEMMKKKRVLFRVLVRLDSTRTQSEQAISDCLDAALNNSRKTWRVCALDRAVSGFFTHSTAKSSQASEDIASPGIPSLALLQAVESLKTSVFELGLRPARALTHDSSDLLSALVSRLSSVAPDNAETEAELGILRSICTSSQAGMEEDGDAIVLIKAALGPLLPQP